MADEIYEYVTNEGDGETTESYAAVDGYDECEWKSFERSESIAEGAGYQYIDDIDSGGQAGGVE